jgi:hypothetical protein
MKINYFISYLFLCLANFSFSQDILLELNWQKPVEHLFEGKTYFIPSIEGQESSGGKPNYFYLKYLKNNAKPNLNDIVYELAPENDLKQLSALNIQVSENLEISYQVTKATNDYYFAVNVFPYKLINNQLHRVKKMVFELAEASVVGHQKDFVTSSVLEDGSGLWYKIAVNKDGIYKIDKNFLESCGISTNGLNPAHIHIYGNGEGVLPELNSSPRIDDLANNALFIQGEADGSFDANDYILFYGHGPHRWRANGTVEFDRKQNIYSDNSYYFININSAETPLRIETLPEIQGIPNSEISSYDYRDVYENDLVNLVGGGQRWYGELFDVELEKTFTFTIPNIDTSPIRFKTALASNSSNSAGTAQNYSINGATLSESPLPSSGSGFARSNQSFQLNNPVSSLPLKIKITRNSPNTLTYLDRIVLNTRRKLVFFGTQFGFRNLSPQDSLSLVSYSTSNFPTNGFIWDISDRQKPKKISGTLTGSTYTFKTYNIYNEYVASNGSSYFTPEKVASVSNQNLHALAQAEFLIITHPDFLAQANRLAELHREEGLGVHVTTTEQIFNEFSSGAPDPTAIRMFAKMFYDRGALAPSTKPKYLLLFGDGTYDPKNRVPNNNNYVLTYQVESSENYIDAMVTDDYYGMLDDNEAISAIDLLDIGVGRILASNLTQAKQQVDKIEHYMKNGSNLFSSAEGSCCLGESSTDTYGDWRTKYVQIADDEEGGYFINNDTEPQYNNVKTDNFEMNCDKLYLDAYPQETSAGGQRYPELQNAITDRVQRGALVLNYVGHGGEVGLAEERVVTIPQINSWTNINKLHVFVSATCEFTKYDDPARVSAGEWAALNPNGGAIALMTTTRAVYFSVNTITGLAFFNNVFDRNPDGSPLTFGEIVKRTKNSSGNSNNKRSFTLIGDPALKIALPTFKVITDSINGKNPLIELDTLNALSKVRIKGHLIDNSGNLMSSFNGVLNPSIFDKPKKQTTLGQDNGSPEIEYELQRNIIYKGKCSVVNGFFDFSFVVPKDIALNIGRGKISYYAFGQGIDAIGADTNFRIGGIDPNGINDDIGPDLELYLNDEKFISGSLSDENPVLFLKAFDENGINTIGNGIGHDIVAILDGKTSDPIVLNDYYTTNLNDYKSGEVRYQFKGLLAGEHTLEVKVWDVNNNSSTARLNFSVQEKQKPNIERVYNYPNPFTTKTEFMFEHNLSCNSLDVQVQVYTISGRLVKTINKYISSKGFRESGIEWDGLDDFGDRLAKGVYIYRLKISNSENLSAEKTEKLVILR